MERGKKVTHEAGRCDEVRIEHEQELALRHRRPFGERSRLEAVPALARDVHDIDAAGLPKRHPLIHDPARLVVGVVEHLHLEQVSGIIRPAHRIDEPAHDVPLIIDRELHRYVRKLLLGPRGCVFVPTPTGQDEQKRPVKGERDQER